MSNFPEIGNKVTNLPKDKCTGDDFLLNGPFFQNTPY